MSRQELMRTGTGHGCPLGIDWGKALDAMSPVSEVMDMGAALDRPEWIASGSHRELAGIVIIGAVLVDDR